MFIKENAEGNAGHPADEERSLGRLDQRSSMAGWLDCHVCVLAWAQGTPLTIYRPSKGVGLKASKLGGYQAYSSS